MQLIKDPTRHLFFTGKGGVGKTSIACVTAIQLADQGLRVLLVSTDPASNLDEVLGTPLTSHPTRVDSVPNLSALNIDPEAAAAEYRERMVGPYRGVLPESAIRSIEEQYSGSCTIEIAAFDEFAKLLGDRDATIDFDHIIFDTAPTGHTLRLLTLPSAWSGFIESNQSGTSCLGPLAGLQDQQSIYQQTVKTLSDSGTTTLALVTRPERSAMREAERTSQELQRLGVKNQLLIINGLFTNHTPDDLIATAMQQRCESAIESLPASLSTIPTVTVPLASTSLIGIPSLRRFGSESIPSVDDITKISGDETTPEGLGKTIDDIARSGHGVVLTMGKGGVGKTTVASAIAVALAERGFQVHLSTTDPAAHLKDTFADDELPGLTVSRIDPAREIAEYRDEVMRSAGADLDASGKALLEEDLRSPCTEEIAVFRAFAKAVAQGDERFVVLDTAPTGHTILLLDAALAHHREVTRQTSEIPEAVQNLLPRLRDPEFTRVLVVTLPEATPVHEASRLQSDLRRAKIEPFAWVINQSLTPLEILDPTLRSRQQQERIFINEISTNLAERVALIPWQASAPTGVESLRRIGSPHSLTP